MEAFKELMRNVIADALKVYFKNKNEILLAFVFGSAVENRLTEESDVDIAIQFNRTPDFSEVLKMTDSISKAIGREVDIVVLNDASPIIRMQVLKNGEVVKSKNEVTYNNFFVKTIKEYDDLKRIRKEAEETILRRRIYA